MLQMPELEKKLLREMRLGSRLLACRFPFPNLPVKSVVGTGVDTVWTYRPKNLSDESSAVS